MPVFNDISGKTIGPLYVIKRVFNKENKRATVWLCRCIHCGYEHDVQANRILKTRKGCVNCHKRKKRPYGEASAYLVFRTYRAHAQKKGREFSLTESQALALFGGNCHYCGATPSQRYSRGRTNGVFVYNGIDRVDNSEGYVLSNCVSCCKNCNRAKLDRDAEEYKNWIKTSYLHLFSSVQ